MTLPPDATFDALARAITGAISRMGPSVASGALPGLRYGAAGTPIPSFNRLMVTRMEPARADRDIDAALAALAAFPVLSAWLAPDGEPPDLVGRFEARGFELGEGEWMPPAMTRPLGDLPALDPITGVTISLARTRDDVLRGAPAMAAAFGAPLALMNEVFERGAIAVVAPGSTVHVVNLSEGSTVLATALGVVADDVVGVYNVATVPEARGRGLGRLATLAVLHEGRAAGARHAVLESTEVAYPLYRRLGFEDVGRFTVLIRAA